MPTTEASDELRGGLEGDDSACLVRVALSPQLRRCARHLRAADVLSLLLSHAEPRGQLHLISLAECGGAVATSVHLPLSSGDSERITSLLSGTPAAVSHLQDALVDRRVLRGDVGARSALLHPPEQR